MSKDRARPFSRKHRKYWIPVTGGMLLIGVINVGIGFCVYEPPRPPPERIIPVLPAGPAGAPVAAATDGSIGLGTIPAPVMRAFATKFPRHAPTGAKKVVTSDGTPTYEISFSSPTTTVVYLADGTFIAKR